MKNWKKIRWHFFYALAIPLSAGANISDTIMLEKVVAKGIKFNCSTVGVRIYTIDSLTLKSFKSGSLSDLLQKQNLLTVKTYGPAGLSSVSMRGGSARHTAIIWNGFNIRSPMNGELDFSSLPAGFIDEIKIQPGGSSTMYGSGATSGVIFLANDLHLDNSGFQTELLSEAGSFGLFGAMASAGYVGRKFSSRLKAGYQAADNDFTFINKDKTNTPTDTLTHAGYKRRALAYQAALRISPRFLAETDLLYANYINQIPAMTFDYAPSNAWQNEESLRFAFHLSGGGDRWLVKLRSGMFYDLISYHDPDENPPIETNNKSFSFINEVESKYFINKKSSLFLGLNQTAESASSQGYSGDISRTRYAVFTRYNFNLDNDRFTFSVEGREELVDAEFLPFVFSLGTEICLLEGLNMKALFARHFSLPIFDDLYWEEDAFSKGNPLLVPEYGWNYETGLAYSVAHRGLRYYHELTFYNHHTYDLIIWLPLEGADNTEGKWMPHNMDESKTYGIELSGDIGLKLDRSAFDFRYMYSFTNAMIFDESQAGNSGHPRIYVPRHSASLGIGYTFSHLHIQYIQTYTGSRYYDNLHQMDPYTLADIYIGYNLIWNRAGIEFYLKVRNIYNAGYQVMAGYAQPPRNFVLGINLSL